MTPEQWTEFKRTYDEIRETPEDQRGALLVDVRRRDPEIADEVERLLPFDGTTARIDHPPLHPGAMRDLLPPELLQPGDLLAQRFRIHSLLGAGGFGRVYEVEDLELRTRLALKTLHPELVSDPRIVSRFRQEINLARQVTHPNVCRVYDFIKTVTPRQVPVAFFTMELLRGETLADRLRRGRFTEPEALPILRQVIAGLAAAHQARVVHRDFKSANIMLCENGTRAVVTDFSVAHTMEPTGEHTTQTLGGAVGTPAYMAPEQIEGGTIGPPADIYALGVVMYEMLTGVQPYVGVSPLAIVAKKAAAPPRPPRELDPGISPAWEAVILRCLERRPEDRFSTVDEVAAALHPQAPLAPPSPRRPLPRSRWWLAIGGLLTLAAVLYWGSRWRSPRPPSPAAERTLAAASLAISENAFSRAAALLEGLVQRDPDLLVARARLAEVYVELDRLDSAKDEIIRLATPQNLASRDRLRVDGARSLVMRDFPAAIRHYQQVVDAQPDSLAALLDLGRAQVKGNQLKAALATFERATALDAQAPAALFQSGLVLNRLGRSPEALARLDQAAAIFQSLRNLEGTCEAQIERGRVLRVMGKPGEAAAQMQKAAALAQQIDSPQQQVRALFEASLLAQQAGEPARAQTLADQGLNLAATHRLDALAAGGLVDLGNAFLTQYKLKEAEEKFRRSLASAGVARARSVEARAQVSLANALFYQGRFREAATLLDAPLRFYRDNGYAEQHRRSLLVDFDIRLELGQTARCADDLRQLAEVDAQTKPLVTQRRADLAQRTGRVADSAALWESLIGDYGRLKRAVPMVYALLNAAATRSESGDRAAAERHLAESARQLRLLENRPAVAEYRALVETRHWLRQSACPAARQSLAGLAGDDLASERRPDRQLVRASYAAHCGDARAGLALADRLIAEFQEAGVPWREQMAQAIREVARRRSSR